MYRKRKIQVKYNRHKKTLPKNHCEFCSLTEDQIIRDVQHFYVVKNISPYTLWDYARVIEHSMIVPKRHLIGMDDLNAVERSEYVDLMLEYEGKGYNIYHRGRDTNNKSIIHPHTHLIKTDSKFARVILYIGKPFIRIFL